jgi:hypothetical protein
MHSDVADSALTVNITPSSDMADGRLPLNFVLSLQTETEAQNGPTTFGWRPMTRDECISDVSEGPSHVVILGAGASIASTLRNPEPSGKTLPSMDNFIDVVGLRDVIGPGTKDEESRNFETLYSKLHDKDPASPVIAEIERRVAEYFRSLALPSTPTIYDYLILALRPKDLIATFNWDPFLYQAFCRNRKMGGVCHSFLHGSVAIGYSREAQKAGRAGDFADQALTQKFVPTRLLYPVTHKDYNTDEFIAREWSRLKKWLQMAKRITIFGYGAPETDVEAVALMSEAWGDPNKRNLEQIEMIDVQSENVLTNRWKRFIHTHHYDYCTDYFQSSLAQFPRRTCESFIHQYLPTTPEEAFQEPNPVPQQFETLTEMWEWHRPLIEAEAKFEADAEKNS